MWPRRIGTIWPHVIDTDRPRPRFLARRGFSSEQVRAAVGEGYASVGGLNELRDVTYVDLPTSHWPMWSRPQDLAAIIGDIAREPSTT
jgi:hypothetical protein